MPQLATNATATVQVSPGSGPESGLKQDVIEQSYFAEREACLSGLRSGERIETPLPAVRHFV